MSLDLMDKVWENEYFTGPETAILIRLAKHADKRGEGVRPGLAHLTATTKYNRRTVLRVLKLAKRAGILTQVGIYHKHPLYAMSISAVIAFKGDRESPRTVTESHPSETVGVTESHRRGDTQSRKGDRESPTIERARKAPERLLKGPKEEDKSIPIPDWLLTLREIEGWATKGAPHEDSLLAWAAKKGHPSDQLERAAVALAGAQSKTLKGGSRLDMAFKVYFNKGYGERGVQPGFSNNGARPQVGRKKARSAEEWDAKK